VVDWLLPRIDRTEGVMLVFDGGCLDASRTHWIALSSTELSDWAWCDAAEAKARLVSVLAARVAAALNARRHGSTGYLESGIRVV
jgi:8-oxo-dGTP diphosphatase